MKQTIKSIAIIAFGLIFPCTINAQYHVERAIKSFASTSQATPIKTLRECNSSGQLTSLCEIYKFTLSSRDSYLLEAVINAFEQDEAEAYYTLNEEANAANRRTTAMTYGEEGESVLVGKNPNTNYRVICFIDNQAEQQDRRYGYAAEWEEDDSGNINGCLVTTYGKKPAGNKKDRTVVKIKDLDFGELEKLGELDSVDWKKLGKEMKGVLGTIARGGAEAIESLKGTGLDLSDIFDSERLRALGDDIYVSSTDINEEQFNDDVTWLTAFNHYRNAFMRAAERKSSTTASYATSLLKLCKQASRVSLSDNEKKLCIKSIKEMKKKSKDDFVDGLLDEAITALK